MIDKEFNKEFNDEPGMMRPDEEENYFEPNPYESSKRRNRSVSQKFFSRAETPFIVIGALLLLFILIFLVFSRKDATDETEPKFALLEERLARLEEQMATIPEINGVVGKLEKQVAISERYADRFEHMEASITMMTDKLARDLAELKKVSSQPVKKDAPAPAPVRAEKRPAPVSKPVYHVVSAKETLYSISRRYNSTVDELRRLNKLSENDAIQPGQKLVVKIGNGKK
ncbi:MAG: LysM domain-containing protein [Desulfobacterales bacterium]|jgi:hypothetical protein|nr:LysM domain-containing protein [Desulfobacterales bacterium]